MPQVDSLVGRQLEFPHSGNCKQSNKQKTKNMRPEIRQSSPHRLLLAPREHYMSARKQNKHKISFKSFPIENSPYNPMRFESYVRESTAIFGAGTIRDSASPVATTVGNRMGEEGIRASLTKRLLVQVVGGHKLGLLQGPPTGRAPLERAVGPSAPLHRPVLLDPLNLGQLLSPVGGGDRKERTFTGEL